MRLSNQRNSNIVANVVHFTVVCFVAKPLNRSEARVDFVVIQTLLLFLCKSLCYHANYFVVSIISRSPLTSLSYKGLVTFHRTVKWSTVLRCLFVFNTCIIFV